MGNYLKTPGGEGKRYNHKLNMLFSKIGQVYGDGTRCSGICYIMKGIPNSTKSQVKKMLHNKKRFSPSYIDDSYLYKIHKDNYIYYARNIIKAISNSDYMIDFVKNELIKNNSGNCLEILLANGIISLNLLADLNIDGYSDKASEILCRIKK